MSWRYSQPYTAVTSDYTKYLRFCKEGLSDPISKTPAVWAGVLGRIIFRIYLSFSPLLAFSSRGTLGAVRVIGQVVRLEYRFVAIHHDPQ